MSITSQLSDTVLYTSYYNVAERMSAGLSIYMNWTILPKWQVYVNGSGGYSYMNAKEYNLSSEGFNYSIYAGTNITLPWKLRLGANGGYFSSSVTLQGRGSDFKIREEMIQNVKLG